MKIGLLVPEMPPDTIGGGGAVFEALARTLHGRGHDVRVVTSHTHGATGERSYPFPVMRLAEFPHPAPAYRTYMPPYPLELLRAREILRSCDVVNAHGHGHPLIDLISRLWLPYRKIVYTLHGFLYTIPRSGPLLANTYRVYDAMFGRPIFRKSRFVTTVSRAVAADAADRGRSDAIVIHNGFDPFGESHSPTESVLAEMERGPYLLCVGRVEMLKGFDIAIDALGRLRDAGRDIRLVIVGRDNGALADLRARIAARGLTGYVSFVGFVDHAALPPLFERALATVVTSRTEAFPATPLEAMSLGSPCVLSRVGGINDIATDERDALLFEVGDDEALARAVERLDVDPVLRERLKRAGLERSRAFLWPAVAAAYESVFERVR